VFDGLHLKRGMLFIKSQYQLYAIVSDHRGFILNLEEIEVHVEKFAYLSPDSYDEWMNIDEEIQTTKVISEEDICDELQSKRRKESVDADCDEGEPEENPSSTKQILEADSCH